MNYLINIYEKARQRATEAFENQTDYGVGSSGYAHVVLLDKRQKFTKWFNSTVINQSDGFGKYVVPVHFVNYDYRIHNSQSIDKKEQWCHAFVEVLLEHGIKAKTVSRLL